MNSNLKINLKSNILKTIHGILVTPELASAFLKTMIVNRPVAKKTVIRYAEMMIRGEWKENGEAIKFLPDGRCCDGQHRLLAVIMCGIAVRMSVQLGTAEDAVQTLDLGGVRALSHTMRMFVGGDNINSRAAYLKMCARMLTGSTVPIKTPTEHQRWLPPFSTGIDWAIDLTSNAKAFAISPIAGALAFAHRTNPAKIEEFGTALVSGEGLRLGDPALTIRKLLTEHPRSDRRDERFVIAKKVLQGAVAHINGERMTKVYGSPKTVVFFRRVYLSSSTVRDIARNWISADRDSDSDAQADCVA